MVLDNGYCRNHQRFASLNITKEELDDIRNGTEYTNIRLSLASGNNGQWVRIEGEFKTSLKQRLQKRIIDEKRRMEGGSKDTYIKNNKEKITEYNQNYRKQCREENEEEYKKKQNEQHKLWYKNNPEKVREINEQRCNDPLVRLGSMKNQALKKGRIWKLTDDYALLLINDVCHYCGGKNESSCNSIDRIDSDLDYTIDNCVTSCSMCNYMKNTLNYYNFLKIIEHICAYNNLNVNAKTNNLINRYNSKSKKYVDYKQNAKKRNYDFLLSEDDFNDIILNQCYICGKINRYDKNNKLIHHNGIDRFDNTIGYVKENCRSCCSVCNYIKKNYKYDNLMFKIKNIYENRCIKINMNNMNINNNCDDFNIENKYDDIYEEDQYIYDCYNIIKTNNPNTENKQQKTKEELKEENRIRVKISRQHKRDEMGEIEYRKEEALKRSQRRHKIIEKKIEILFI